MFVLFEEAGKYLGGRVLSEAEASAQVELDSGKRVKVKGANIVLRFEKPGPSELIAEARALAATMDLDCGPVISAAQRNRVLGFIERARAEGVTLGAPELLTNPADTGAGGT